MKKLVNKILTFACTLTVACSLLPAVSVFAAQSYTVKFRAGDVNTFNEDVLKEVGIEGNANFFSIQVDKNENVSDALSKYIGSNSKEQINVFFERVLNENASYAVKSVDSWCDEIDSKIKHNESYVLDYAKIVNPVKYTVYFLDTDDASQIATPWIRYVDASLVGTTITVEPIEVKDYLTTNTAVEFELSSEDGQEIRFFYSYVGEFVHVSSGEQGEVTYNDIINEVVVNAPQVNGEDLPDNNNGGQQNNNQNNNQNNENQGGAEDEPQEPSTEIEDPDTPAGAGTTEIEDEKPPLHGNDPYNNPIQNVIFISAICGVIALFVVVITLIIRNQKKHVNALSDKKDNMEE